MRLFILSSAILLTWSGAVRAGGDSFAAVPGTGWTDVTQLQSTCTVPGYFVNSYDCSKFYQCVDHSTPEHRLFLRYDFECAAGTVFDEANKICNFPGPSGCIGGGWGWRPPTWRPPHNGWRPPNSGWAKDVGITVTKGPSWGTPVGTTVIHKVSTTPGPIPANPRVNLPPATHIVHIPTSGFESFKIRNPGTSGVFQRVQVTTATPPTGSWESSKVVTAGPGVFESAKVITQQGPHVTWGSTQIPVQTGVYHGHRVTPVPHTEWEGHAKYPVVSHPHPIVVEDPHVGWSPNTIHQVTPTPSPSPIPSNHVHVIYNTGTPAPPTVAPGLSWQASRISPPPAGAWQGTRTTQISQPHTSIPAVPAWQSTRIVPSPSPPSVTSEWQSSRIIPSPSPPPVAAEWQGGGGRVIQTQGQEPVRITWGSPQVSSQQFNVVQGNEAIAANPSFSLPPPPGGWDNVHISQLPSGFSWQSNGAIGKSSQPEAVITSSQGQPSLKAELESNEVVQPIQEGNFGIVQQVIDEQQGPGAEGKSHIQLIYETKEKQNEINVADPSQSIAIGQAQGQNVAVTQAQIQSANEIQQGEGSINPSGPVYEIVPSPGSGIKGRIIVLYAPVGKGGKRDVPVIEVTLDEEGNVESTNTGIQTQENLSPSSPK